MIWPCELHSIETAPQGSLLIIQYPGHMLSCTSELHMLQDFITHQHLLSAEEFPERAEQAAKLLRQIKTLSESAEPFRDTRKQICLMELLLLLGRTSPFRLLRTWKQTLPGTVPASSKSFPGPVPTSARTAKKISRWRMRPPTPVSANTIFQGSSRNT